MVLNPGANTASKLNDDEYLSYIALHEFGHLAGLRHEQLRVEASEDQNCKRYAGLHGEKPFLHTRLVGPYDPNSIMSLCFNAGLSKTGLNFLLKDLNDPLFLQDHTLFSSILDFDGLQVKVRIGLSTGDLESLKCLYAFENDGSQEKCDAY